MNQKQKSGVHITINPVVHEPLSPAVQAALMLMACRNCGTTMERGTQCKRCGAWCR